MAIEQIWTNLPVKHDPRAPVSLPNSQVPSIFIPHERRTAAEELKTKICIHKLPVYKEEEPKPKGIGDWDPILISLVRRAMPSLIAFDVCGVQPMTGPTGLIFAMKAKYGDKEAGRILNTNFNGPGVSPLTAPSEEVFAMRRNTVNSAMRKEQAKEFLRVRQEQEKKWRKMIKSEPEWWD